MSKVRGTNTLPEMRVRRALHSMDYRFRLHRPDLPGKPDIVLQKHRVCIFVHGCFWHSHPGCVRATTPESNGEFWAKKLAGNVERDRRSALELAEMGWRVCVIWECETRYTDALVLAVNRCMKHSGPISL
ncbi:very short patch repair endonuclease [uncultured Thiodictyon sp.]|nr:very short patch repair endonuclease [uncultured Thiodictyon sp.]